MQFLPRLLSRRTTPRRQKICGNGLSLSLEASPWRKPLYRGQSDFEWPQVRTGLDPLHRLAFSFFFFFSAENPTKTSTLNQSTLSLSRCSPIYRVINLSDLSRWKYLQRACVIIQRIDRRKRKRRYFFLIWRSFDSNIESRSLTLSPSQSCCFDLSRLIERIHLVAKNICNARSLTFMLQET